MVELSLDSIFVILSSSVSAEDYNQVCGRIRAYQKGLPSAYNLNGKTSVDDAYILQWCACIAWQSSTAHLDLCCRREGSQLLSV